MKSSSPNRSGISRLETAHCVYLLFPQQRKIIEIKEAHKADVERAEAAESAMKVFKKNIEQVGHKNRWLHGELNRVTGIKKVSCCSTYTLDQTNDFYIRTKEEDGLDELPTKAIDLEVVIAFPTSLRNPFSIFSIQFAKIQALEDDLEKSRKKYKKQREKSQASNRVRDSYL